MSRRSSSNELLPRCEGPKLHAFPHRHAKVNFVRLMSDPELEGQSHVFEVSINSKSYALKVFKYYDDEEDFFGLEKEELAYIGGRTKLYQHNDFFNSECRAFGRIIEANLNGKIAVHCYGYMMFPAELEDELGERFEIDTWNRPEEEYAKPLKKRQPLRAIVKELISHDCPMTNKLLNKILRDLKKMRRLGVYPNDVQQRNYRDGMLVDMSVAITKPHFLFDILPEWRIVGIDRNDLMQFEDMAKDAGFGECNRAIRNQEYCDKLRSAKNLKRWM